MYLKDPGLPGVFSAAAQALPPAVFGLLRRPRAVAGQATVSSSALPVSASACVCLASGRALACRWPHGLVSPCSGGWRGFSLARWAGASPVLGGSRLSCAPPPMDFQGCEEVGASGRTGLSVFCHLLTS